MSKADIKSFERDQKQFGTEVALANVLWSAGSDLMRRAGVTKIKTTYAK